MEAEHPIRILFVEDNPHDTELATRELNQGTVRFTSVRVDTKGEFLDALEKFRPDIIISDYSMPEFDGMQALKLAKEKATAIPFILLTGSMNEETAVECMKAGAMDYVIKERIKRLPFAVKEAVEQKNTRLEKEEARRALRENEKKFRRLYEQAPIPYQSLDINGNILDVNNAWLNELGYQRAEVIGRWFGDFLPGNGPELFLERFDILKSRGENSGVEFEMRRKDGSVITTSFEARIGNNEKGEFLQTHCVFTNVTERRRAEEELRKLSRAVEQSPASVIITDLNGNIEYVNPKFTEVTGYRLEEARGKNPRILKSGETPQEEYRKLWETVTSGGEWHGVFHNKRKDGTLFWERASISSVHDASGTITHLVAVKEDITDQKSLEDQYRQAQKMEAIGQLAGGISHDFNNILTALIGYAHLLKVKLQDDEKLQTYVDHILSLSDKATSLTQGLLAFSRKQVMNPRPVKLNEIIRAIDRLLFRIIGEDIQLKTNLSDEDPTILADHMQVEQILMNLATNARDAMPRGGLLTIATEKVDIDQEFIRVHGYGKEGPYVVMSVTDSGEGMDRKTREKIFEPFFTTKEAGKGTGLGLSMVYGIIKQHDGYVNVYSEPGEGTTFRIYFPMIGEKVDTLSREFVQPLATGTETILLAEDEDAVRAFNKKLLEEYGYNVIEAVDGEDAITKFRLHKNKIRMVILDVIMPNRNGREAYEAIRKISPAAKVLFTSGYPADHINGIIEKGSDYILKPVSPTKLLQKIREVLDA